MCQPQAECCKAQLVHSECNFLAACNSIHCMCYSAHHTLIVGRQVLKQDTAWPVWVTKHCMGHAAEGSMIGVRPHGHAMALGFSCPAAGLQYTRLSCLGCTLQLVSLHRLPKENGHVWNMGVTALQ